MSFTIAIDGPAGAGKSTIAKKLAQELSFVYVDTGAMYRAMALYFLRSGIRADEDEALRRAVERVEITITCSLQGQRVFLNGEDVTGLIRKEEVGNMASATSGYPFVREKLLGLQRKLAEENDVIMDGRDIGTCVLPGAQLKVYLTASVRTRALRRYRELLDKGEMVELSSIEEDIARRDDQDMHREVAPLAAAEDARILDSSDMDIGEVTAAILAMAAEAGLKREGE